MKIEWSPPGKRSCTSHTNHAAAPASTGSSWPGSSATPSNLSGDGVANVRAIPSCPSRRTLTANRLLCSSARCVGIRLLTQTSSRIGSSDTDATALAVMPARPSSVTVVTTVTPVAKCAIASRYTSVSLIPLRLSADRLQLLLRLLHVLERDVRGPVADRRVVGLLLVHALGELGDVPEPDRLARERGE